MAGGRELAAKLGAKLCALVISADATLEVSKQYVSLSSDETFVVEDPGLEFFSGEAYASALIQVVRAVSPEVVLVGGTKKGKELAARLAGGLGVGCMTDCTSLALNDEMRLVGKRLTYGGSCVAEVVCLSVPQIATVPAGVFQKEEATRGDGEIVPLKVVLPKPRLEVLERRSRAKTGFRLDQAPVVIGCGRAFKRKEDLAILDDLAKVLDARVSCTRPLAADYHWFEEWVGLSGLKIRPRLYISFGVSGTIQHVTGIRDAQTIVAINSDESAAIFNVADYGVVGDVFKVVPALTKKLRERLSK